MVEIIEKKTCVSPLKLTSNNKIKRFDGVYDESVALFDADYEVDYLARVCFTANVDCDVKIEINWSFIYEQYMDSPYNLFSECEDLNEIMQYIHAWIDSMFRNVTVDDIERFMYGENVESIMDDLYNNVNAFPNLNVIYDMIGQREEFEHRYTYYNKFEHTSILVVIN